MNDCGQYRYMRRSELEQIEDRHYNSYGHRWPDTQEEQCEIECVQKELNRREREEEERRQEEEREEQERRRQEQERRDIEAAQEEFMSQNGHWEEG